jgi:hypothetical protein
VARTRSLAVCLGLVLATSQVRAQETYTIRLRPPGPGETTRCEDTLTTEMTTRLTDPSGAQEAHGKDQSVRRAVYQETILQRDPAMGAVQRLRRQCETATLEVNNKQTRLPFHGKTFTVERGPTGCRVRFEGQAPAEQLVRDLEEGFAHKKDVNIIDEMLPRQPVRCGDTWRFDPKPLLVAWPKPPQIHINADGAVGRAKLMKVTRREGRLFGELEFDIEAPVVGVDFGPRAATLEPGTRLTVLVTVEACIDGSASTFTLRMQDQLIARVLLANPSGQRITSTLSEQHLRSETRP